MSAFLNRILPVLVCVLAAAVFQGFVRIPLPYPAVGEYIHATKHNSLPWKPSPLEGVYAPNRILQRTQRLFEGDIHGSESVAFNHSAGTLTMLDRYGAVYEAAPEGQQWRLNKQPIARLGVGRPLGAHYDAAGNLIVCDALKGLVMVEAGTRRVVLLTSRVSDDSPLEPGTRVTYANDLDIASDGTIYFTDSQTIQPAVNAAGFWDTYRAYMLGLLSGRFAGRLLSYDPSTGNTRVLARGFYFCNGVALSKDESFVAVVETSRIRVLRHWLLGAKAGKTEVMLDELPGVPDGLSRSADGSFWVSLLVPIKPVLKHLRYAPVRALLAWLPDRLKPAAGKWGAILKMGAGGQPLELFMDPDGSKVAFISSTLEQDGKLFFGNLVENYVSYIDVAELKAGAGHAA